MSAQLVPIGYQDIPNWKNDDHLAAFESFIVSAQRMVIKPYKTRALGVSGAALAAIGKVALEVSQSPMSVDDARSFFETNFQPHKVQGEAGFLTGFFEPVVSASKTRTPQFSEPLYLRPPDLVDVTDKNRPLELDKSFRYGKITENGIEEYFDRKAISTGALAGRGLELVYLKNKVDAFFIHVQGAAKLILQEGGVMRVTYAAKSGHPYSSIAKKLCAQLNVPAADMTADRLKEWMLENPDNLDDLLFHNRSFIFFEEVQAKNEDTGPIAAAKTPLIPNRSLAVDRTLHTFGTPIWLTTTEPLPEETHPLARLMVAHDTGSAIVGPARGDIFTGSGDKAGLKAGRVRHDANMVVFMPRENFDLSSLSNS
jgi:membrane-bound lytic murein transglycosylase A